MQRFRLQRWGQVIVFLIAGLEGRIGIAQELCGIDSIFYNGFEVTSGNPAAASTPGGILSPGVATSITAGGLGVVITCPTTEIAGTFTGPTDTGITVNGVVAATDSGKFLASAVPLQSGSNTITVSAATLTGNSASASISLTQGSASPPVVALTVFPPVNYSPLLATFTTSIGALPGGATVNSVAIDYNGDGTDDITNPAPGTLLTYLATVPNLYAARLTVVDSNNVTYVAYAHYLVGNLSQQSGMFCDVYGYLKQRLTAQDTAGALTAIDPTAQVEYQTMFTNNASTLPAYVANLGNIVDGYMSGKTATMIVVRQNPDQTLSGFQIEISQGSDGTWRITKM
jgi:hypothetical protein